MIGTRLFQRAFSQPAFSQPAFTQLSGYEAELRELSNRAARTFKFPLPPSKSMSGSVPCIDQGWKFKTEVKEAVVKAAGNGRYCAQGLEIKNGDLVVEKILVPMKDISTLVDVNKIPQNATISFSNEADLEKYIHLACTEGGYSRSQINKLFEHFPFSIDGKVMVLGHCTWTVNHGGDALPDDIASSENLKFFEDSRKNAQGVEEHFYQAVATRDIAAGDEFYLDYRRFVIPDFFIRFSEKNGFDDVRRATLKAVYG
eukprot:CAMPEP_0116033418 /NCGR_PEP_ID=MMETSP0321-20121206/18978_1 /TAXON_ID=163516 /ORGANISM="Leptocylindrus danicus var. danicus, Strain B650" /LENGTH=256 /DNA_ID=CAMNT_0003509491 /DNA_START=14 /DNA_END=780 /DNA_ORIENTATION=-